MQYFTRYKLIQGLSRYNEDDTVSEREEAQKVTQEDHHYLDRNYHKTEERQIGEYDDRSICDTLGHMARYIGSQPFDKVVEEFLLNTYDNIDEQEFQVCKWIIWTLWDIREPMYGEVVARILNSDEGNGAKYSQI